MDMFAFVCGLLGVGLSTLLVLSFAIRESKVERRRTLSELAARNEKTVKDFRIILWTCGTLISVMMYGLVIPNTEASRLVFLFYSAAYISEIALAVVPARKGLQGLFHNIFAYTMGLGMLSLAFVFGATLTGAYGTAQYVLCGLMVVLMSCALIFSKHFLLFELPFIFTSHVTLVIAAIYVLNR
jgi:hypothetical protein